MADKTAKAEAPAEPEKTFTVVATCKCGASKEATANTEDLATSQAVTYIPHKDGCTCNNEYWQGWVKVAAK